MTQAQQKQWYEEDKKKIMERLDLSEADWASFKKIGKDLRMLYERQCNGYPQQLLEDRDNQREKIFVDKAVKRAEKLGLKIFFQTDPRGATIYLDSEPIPENNYNKAHCIY